MSDTKQLNTNRLDNSTYLYGALNIIKSGDNVINDTVAQTEDGNEAIYKYLGVSKPEIIFSKDENGNDIMPNIYIDDII